jgi:oligoribonuclease
MAESNLLVWIDMEMTGLDPGQHRILEIATLITNADLEIVAEGPELVIHQSEEVLAKMNDWSRTQHAGSGLLDRVRRSSTSEAAAETSTLEFIARHCPAGAAPLSGNSVHLDRRFLQHHMPKLEAHLHYRNVDVSTLKELVKRWYPTAFANAPKKADRHRALEDLHDSIAELRYYRTAVFRAPGSA